MRDVIVNLTSPDISWPGRYRLQMYETRAIKQTKTMQVGHFEDWDIALAIFVSQVHSKPYA